MKTIQEILEAIDLRIEGHKTEIDRISKRIALTDAQARRRANDQNSHVDAINALASLREFATS